MSGWLISRRFDLGVFVAPALFSLALVPLGPLFAPDGDTPLPMWILGVLAVDVAHVWATIFRTYLDRRELGRHPARYALTPVLVYAVGLALASIGSAWFWTVLAYLAVFHFVRQQYGWVVLYERRDPGHRPLDRYLDAAAIYAATLFPIVWWHAHLPRRYAWLIPGDFLPGLVTPALARVALAVYVLALGAFAARQILRWRRGQSVSPGKILLVVTTALCWGVGIVLTDSDWAFTVTNVFIHGVPYFAVVYVYGRKERQEAGTLLGWIFGGAHLGAFLGILWGLALLEELAWDVLLWHERFGPLFAAVPDLAGGALALVLPLLALPQATHYVLDGFLWRRQDLLARGG